MIEIEEEDGSVTSWWARMWIFQVAAYVLHAICAALPQCLVSAVLQSCCCKGYWSCSIPTILCFCVLAAETASVTSEVMRWGGVQDADSSTSVVTTARSRLFTHTDTKWRPVRKTCNVMISCCANDMLIKNKCEVCAMDCNLSWVRVTPPGRCINYRCVLHAIKAFYTGRLIYWLAPGCLTETLHHPRLLFGCFIICI